MPIKKVAPRKQNLNVNSKWLNNTLRSLGISTASAFADLMPATSGTLSTGTRLATETARTIRQNPASSKLIQDAIKNNQLVKIGQDFFKNAVSDLRSGQWNDHMDRGSMGDMVGDMDTMFGDMDEMFSGMEDDGGTDVIVNNVNTSNDASVRAIERSTEYNVRAAKATVDTMVALGSTSLIRMEELGTKAIAELTNINSTLSALLEYQNTNMTKFIEASIGYYEQMSSSKEESSSTSTIKPENLYSDKGLDFSTYKDYVIQNIKKIKEEDGTISMVSMLVENLPDMLANPMELATKTLVKGIIPRVTKDAMAAMDRSVQNFIPYLLERIGALGENQFGPIGSAFQYIGRIFGTRTTAKKSLDFADIKTGPMPYNGKANHTITEIIPKYLRESNNYLRIIAEHFTGQSAEQMNRSALGFNWSTGRFQSMQDMQKSMQEDYINQVLGGLSTSEFGKKFLSTGGSVLEDDNEKSGLENILQQIIVNAMQSGKSFDFKNENQIQEIVDSLSATETQKRFVLEFLREMKARNDEILGNLEYQRVLATNRNNTFVRGLSENNGTSTSAYQLYSSRNPDDENILRDISEHLKAEATQNGNQGPIPRMSSRTPSNESLRNAIREAQIPEDEGGATAKPFRAFANVLNSIMAGNADGAWDAFMRGIGDSFRRAGSFLSRHFLNPIKSALFGERGENGYIRGGIFEGINNRMKESFYSFRRMITGKGYKDANGNEIPNATEEEMKNTVLGQLKSSVNWMKDAIAVRLFGEKNEDGTYKVDDDGNEKDGLLGKTKRGLAGATSSLLGGLVGWKKALFGETKEGEEEETGEEIFQKLKDKAAEVAPSAITGSIGGGLLGFLVGGPIGGAMLGFAGGIASKSDRFKKWLFGDDESEGVISKNVQNYVKENSKFLAGGALIGGIQGATGIGLLGGLVGGPITGALLGIGTSMVLKSDAFKKFLFGDAEKGQLGLKQHAMRWMKKLGMSTTGEASGGKLAGMAGVGAIGGGLIGMMVGGPIFGALGGLGLSILAQKDNFHEWLFGSVDEKTGAKKEGILGQFKNMLTANVFTPVINTVKNIGDDFKTYLRYDIFGKLNLIVERLGDSFFGAVSRITGTAMASIGDFGSYIKENFLRNMVEGIGNILSPITTAATKVAEGVYSVGKAIVAAPLNIMMAALSPAVSAVTSVIGTVGSAMVKTVDMLLLKPINALIIKPLGGAIKLAGKVIAAPFKMISNAFNWFNEKVVAGLGHITRFASAVADHVKNEFTTKIVDPVKKKVNEVFVSVRDFILKPFNILADFGKDILVSVGTYAKQKISGFFSQALHMLNPITWLKGVTKLGSAALNIVSGGRLGTGPKEKPEGRGESQNLLARLWRETKTGTGKDRTNQMIFDSKGEMIDTKLPRSKRVKALYEERAAERANNAVTKAERRNSQKNQQMIRKYTKGQRVEDTEENRRLAEAAAGHELRWGDVKPKKTEFEKLSTDYYDETTDLQTQIRDYMRDVARFILGKNYKAYGKDTPEAAAAAARSMGARMQERRDARQSQIDEIARGESYHARQDARDAQIVNRRLIRHEDKDRRAALIADVQQNGLWSGIRNSAAIALGRLFGDNTDEDVPANAFGTTGAKPGYSIVGEKGPEAIYRKNARFGKFVGLNGPEVVKMQGGETVIPNHKLPKYEDGIGAALPEINAKSDDVISRTTDTTKLSMSERILRKLSEIKSAIIGAFVGSGPSANTDNKDSFFGGDGSDNNMVNDGEENSVLDQAAAQSLVTTKTGAALRAAKEDEEPKEDMDNSDAQLATLDDLTAETKKHNSVWESIFSEKGLITAGILAAIPLITAFLKSDVFKNILNVLKNVGDILEDFFGDARDQWDWTNEEDARENGETVDERAAANAERIANFGIFDENGEADHISYPAAKLVARGAFNVRNIIRGVGKAGAAIGKGAASVSGKAVGAVGKGASFVAGKAATGAKNTKALADLVLENGDEAWDLADNFIQKTGAKAYNAVRTSTAGKAASSAANAVSSAGKAVSGAVSSKVATVAEPLAKVATTGSALFKQVSDVITTFFDDILKKFSSKTGLKVTASILTKIKPSTVINAIKSRWSKLAEKIATTLGVRGGAAALSAGIAEAVFVGLAAINGLSGTAKLFHVRSEDVDNKMRIIATVFGGLLGTTPGAIIDLVASVFYDVTGIDLLSSLATALYNFWAGEENGLKLEESQAAFQKEYVDYQDKEVHKQYETQLAAGLISSDTTYEQFYEMAHAGTVGIDYKSFANYNADVNASLGDKAMAGISTVGKGIVGAWDWLTGKDEVIYTDDSGNTYRKNDNGTYQVTSATGEDLGYVAEDALSQRNMTETVKENDNILQKAGKGIANVGSTIWNGAKSLGSSIWGGITDTASAIGDAGSAAVSAVKDRWNVLKDGVKWLTSRETATGYYDVDGSYYLSNGEHYTANGELIETVSLADLSALIVSGQLSEPTEIVTKDFGFVTLFKEGYAKVQEGLKTAGENLKQFGANVVQKAKDVWGNITNAVSNAKTSVVNFFTAHPEKVWFDTDGSYWKLEGNSGIHYNSTGDKIGDPITSDELSAMITSGALSEGEIQVDSGLKQGIAAFGQAISNGWKKFTTAASNFGNLIVEKAGAAIATATNVAGKTLTGIKNFLFAHTEKRYFDTDGGYYQTNGDTFDYYNQNGDLITEGITADEFAELLKSGAVTEGNVQEVTVNSGLRSWFDDMASRGKEAFTKWKDNAAEMWSGVVDKAGSAVKAIADAGGPIAFIGGLFTTKKEKAWFDTNGNYYKMESDGSFSKYNMNGDVLEEDIPAEKIQELAATGLLTEGDVEVDTEAQKAVKQIKDAVASAWEAAKNTVKSGWESFKNWITGGSGTNSEILNNYRPDTTGFIPGGSGFGINKSSFVRGGRGETQPSMMNGIPYYSQNDRRWANAAYEPLNRDDGATMSNTGCGPTAMSMVIGGMTGDKPLPTELASYAQFTGTRDETGTNWNFIDSAASTYGLNSTRSVMPSKNFIADNLSSGNPMILSGQSDNRGPYTRAGHYIVATGIDSNGNVSYNDPRGASYSGRMNINDFINNTGAAWSFTSDPQMGAFGVSARSRKVFDKNKFKRGGRGTGIIASDIIAIAKNEVGYIGKRTKSDLDSKTANAISTGEYNGYTKYARDTFPSNNGLPWCAMFVCWVFKTAANGDESKAKELMCNSGYSASCSYIKKAFTAKNQVISNTETPLPGDIVLFNFKNGKAVWPNPQHVGIVVGTNGDKVITVEGNTSAKSQDTGGCVEMKERSRDIIVCFCRPMYDDTSAFAGISIDSSAAVGVTSSSSYTSMLSQYTSMFGNLANAVFDAALTNNTDIDWTKVFSDTTSSGTSTSTSLITSGVVDPGDINERTKKVIEFFRAKGLTDAQIAGILGCWKAESGVTPGKVEGYYLDGYPSGLNYAVDRSAVDSFTLNTLFPAYARSGISINKNAYLGNDGHYYPGVGLAQWTGPRGQNYANIFTKGGYKFGQIEPELELVWNELSPGGARSYALPALKDADTPDEATDAFCRKFEGYSGADGIRERQLYARQFYNSMDDIVQGGSGDGLSIANHKYLTDKDNLGLDTAQDTSGSIKPLKTSIKLSQISKSGSGVGRILRGGSGSMYDDTILVGLLNQVVNYLGTISTNTKQLDLLKDIKDASGSTLNYMEVRGGNTTSNTNVNNSKASQRPVIQTELSRNEMTARRIAGIRA